MVAPNNPAQINIVIGVDSIGALSDQSLENNVFMMDTSPWQSTGQGTTKLSTFCRVGQVIRWVATAIDLQTPVTIKHIRFIGLDPTAAVTPETCQQDEGLTEPPPLDWRGIVPENLIPGIPYFYQLELQMGEGVDAVLSCDTASLMRI